MVETKAPIVGSHYEGGTRITDHVLDRSKFDSRELYAISDALQRELHAGPDPDGFLASAYFNAKLLALSVDIVNTMENGLPVQNRVHEVESLGQDPYVESWLKSSRFWPSYRTLCLQLKRYVGQYQPGTPLSQLDNEYDIRNARLKELKKQLDYYEAAQDAESYNSLIPEYNRAVRDTNSILRRSRVQAVGSQKLDLAFNRCLDSGILMSKFQQVSLTSHAAEIEAMPEPDSR